MKIKCSKRTVSEYEQSLSSHDSQKESILNHFQSSSIINSSSCTSKSLAQHQNWVTPYKAAEKNEKSYTVKKVNSPETNKEGQSKKEGNRIFSSEDSKIIKRQDYYSKKEKLNFDQHAKVLRFDEESCAQGTDKQNQAFRSNLQQLSSEDERENQLIWNNIAERKKTRQRVGQILYEKQQFGKLIAEKMGNILEEESNQYIE